MARLALTLALLFALAACSKDTPPAPATPAPAAAEPAAAPAPPAAAPKPIAGPLSGKRVEVTSPDGKVRIKLPTNLKLSPGLKSPPQRPPRKLHLPGMLKPPAALPIPRSPTAVPASPKPPPPAEPAATE